MTITELDLITIKNYLRIDGPEDDILIELMLTSAKSFIENYLNQKFVEMVEVPSEFTIACLALISHWYEKRAVSNDKASKEILYSFSGILDMHRIVKMGEGL